MGLAFKPNIDDLRESPAVKISSKIREFHIGKLFVVEPNINVLPDYLSPKFSLSHLSSKEVLNADIKVLLVDHDEFKEIQHTFNNEKQK